MAGCVPLSTLATGNSLLQQSCPARSRAVGVAAVDAAIEHHHLAVHTVEGAEPEVSVAEHLPEVALPS